MAHHPTSWHDRIEVIDGKVTRILTAYYCKGKYDISIDIYKENEDGECWMRNCFSSMWGGYVVCFPGLPINTNPYSYYYCKDPAEEEDWQKIDRRCRVGDSDYCTHSDENVCIMQHYNFKYVLKKWRPSCNYELISKLIMWKLHPEVELPLALGFDKLAMNKSFYRLRKENQRKVAKFCKNHPEAYMFTLNEILKCVRSKDCELMVDYLLVVTAWMQKTITLEDFRYLQKKKLASTEGVYLYSDYKKLVEKLNHDITNKYWKYPTDLQKRHDKLMEESRVIEELRRQAIEQATKKASEKELAQMQKVIKKYTKYNGEIDGYQIFFSGSYDDWKKQADVLNQCIIYANYIKQVAERRCLIVFIRQNDNPIATVQIMPNKKIGQFYADEHDRNNCLPSEEVKAVFSKWVEKVRVREVI